MSDQLIWAWPLHPFTGGGCSGCHDGVLLRPVAPGVNVRLGSEFQIANNPQPGSAVGLQFPDCSGPQQRLGNGRRYYLPTDEDLAIVISLYPDADPQNPSWEAVQRDLAMAGVDTIRLGPCDAPTIIRFLDEVTKNPQAPLPSTAMKVAQPEDRELVGNFESPAEYVFHRSGDGWLIQAFGERGHFKNMKGLECLAKLLNHAGKSVPVTYLATTRKGVVTSQDAAALGLHEHVVSQPIIDEAALQDLRRRIQECDEGIQDAESEGDPVVREACLRERESLYEQLQHLAGPGGKVRHFASTNDKLRQAIYHALNRAFTALRQGGMRKTADHFEAAVIYQNYSFEYQPNPSVNWSIKM